MPTQPIGRFAIAILCFFGVCPAIVSAQNFKIQPLHVASGTVLDFHLETLLRPASGDPLAALPEGTLLQVRMLDSIDSRANYDGDVFHGLLVSSVTSGNKVLIQAGAAVQGMLVLLRSQKHPGGFRYELLLTGITDLGETYALTASLAPSLSDTGAHPRTGSVPASRASPAGTGRAPSEHSPKTIH
ncbi:MAG TPA: hypothetical protein VJN21_06135 [Candidatus Acidoferrales bacterium]|nr:hypothetical protein [Candidatus Acidoferrales bacterium]